MEKVMEGIKRVWGFFAKKQKNKTHELKADEASLNLREAVEWG